MNIRSVLKERLPEEYSGRPEFLGPEELLLDKFICLQVLFSFLFKDKTLIKGNRMRFPMKCLFEHRNTPPHYYPLLYFFVRLIFKLKYCSVTLGTW